MAKPLSPMTESQWFDLFEHGLRSLGDRLPQALRLKDTGEQWIQAQLSLYAWYQHDMEIWSGDRSTQALPGCLFTHDRQMAVEIKYLRKQRARALPSLPMDDQPAAQDAAIRVDLERLKSLQGYQHKFMVVVATDGLDTLADNDPTCQSMEQRRFAIDGGSIRVCRV